MYLFSCVPNVLYKRVMFGFWKSYFQFHWFLKADVNAVTFADESSDVLYSGSDDSLCKVS